MRNQHRSSEASKDLHENRHLYKGDELPKDQQVRIRSVFEGVLDTDDDMRDLPTDAMAALLGQYRKDLLFERDPRTAKDLRDHIAAIEAELEVRKIEWRERAQRDFCSAEDPTDRLNAKLDADAAWRRLTQPKRTA